MKAMILAAGVGSRMQPLSEHWPKPALPVLDRSLLARMVESLAGQGVDEVVVNAHPHSERLRESLVDAPVPILYSEEPRLLGSGGGILAARRWLEGDGSFLVLNGDMLIDLDVAALLAAHRRSGAVATIALRDDPRKPDFGTIGYGKDPVVTRITERVDLGGEQGCGLFTGVHVMEAQIFERMPASGEFGIVDDVYIPLLRAGGPLGAWLQPSEARWTPVGTPRELLDANLRALGDETGDPAGVWIGKGAEVADGARVGPRAVIGAGAAVPDGAVVRDALLLPGARLQPGARLERAIGYDTRVWRDD